MCSLHTSSPHHVESSERELADITAAAGASGPVAGHAAAGVAVDANDVQHAAGEAVNDAQGEAAAGECEGKGGGKGEGEEIGSEKPLLMSDISQMMETMHSKNLMLKKLVRMQQKRVELLKTENEELRRDGKRKDARLKNAEVTMEYLRREMEEQRGGDTNNKQASSGDSGSLDERATTVRRNSATATGGSGKQRARRTSAHWVMQRVARRVSAMKGGRAKKGVALCVCTLGGALVLAAMLHSWSRDGGDSSATK
ncbi:unnamed protein product [Agarophyton chilense]